MFACLVRLGTAHRDPQRFGSRANNRTECRRSIANLLCICIRSCFRVAGGENLFLSLYGVIKKNDHSREGKQQKLCCFCLNLDLAEVGWNAVIYRPNGKLDTLIPSIRCASIGTNKRADWTKIIVL